MKIYPLFTLHDKLQQLLGTSKRLEVSRYKKRSLHKYQIDIGNITKHPSIREKTFYELFGFKRAEAFFRLANKFQNKSDYEKRLRSNYRKLALILHPDKNQNSNSTAAFQSLQNIYKNLLKNHNFFKEFINHRPSPETQRPAASASTSENAVQPKEVRTGAREEKILHQVIMQINHDSHNKVLKSQILAY